MAAHCARPRRAADRQGPKADDRTDSYVEDDALAGAGVDAQDRARAAGPGGGAAGVPAQALATATGHRDGPVRPARHPHARADLRVDHRAGQAVAGGGELPWRYLQWTP